MSRSDFGKPRATKRIEPIYEPGKIGFNGPFLKYLSGHYPLRKDAIYMWDAKDCIYRIKDANKTNL